MSVDGHQERKPLLDGGDSVLLAEDVCLNTGLDLETLEQFVREQLMEDSFWTAKGGPLHLFGIREEALPSRESLVAVGLPVRDDYDPDRFRYGGIDCVTHRWAPAVLLVRRDEESGRTVPDGTMCWECQQAGVAPGEGNWIPIQPDELERWLRTHDEDGTALTDADDDSET